MRVVVVPELDDERMAIEQRLDDAALDPAPAAVNEPDLGQPRLARGMQVLVDDRGNVRRLEGVQVELARDGDGDRIVGQFIFFRTPRRRWS